MKKITIILAVVLLAFGCNSIKPEQKILSEAADATPIQRTGDCDITINNEKKGSLTDLAPLNSIMSRVIKEREQTGTFKIGTNDIENTVYVLTDPNISAKNFAEIALAVNKVGGKAYFPKADTDQSDQIVKPNPLTLVVKCGDPSKYKWMPPASGERVEIGSFAYSPKFEYFEDLYRLKLSRLGTISFEISADDKYFVNDVSDPTGRPDIYGLEVKQRPVAPADLKAEAAKVGGEGKVMTIIASENASFAGLMKIFEAANRPDLEFSVLIRKHDLKKR